MSWLIIVAVAVTVFYVVAGGVAALSAAFLAGQLGTIAFIHMKYWLFPLADEVFIDEDTLLVRRGDVEEAFPVKHIVHVEQQSAPMGEQIKIHLQERTELGLEITFMPPERGLRLGAHPAVGELLSLAGSLRDPDDR